MSLVNGDLQELLYFFGLLKVEIFCDLLIADAWS